MGLGLGLEMGSGLDDPSPSPLQEWPSLESDLLGLSWACPGALSQACPRPAPVDGPALPQSAGNRNRNVGMYLRVQPF